jgi:hypothetical protein
MVCATTKKASTVCPESVLPASVIVPETIIEYHCSSFTSSMAKALLWHLGIKNSFYQK